MSMSVKVGNCPGFFDTLAAPLSCRTPSYMVPWLDAGLAWTVACRMDTAIAKEKTPACVLSRWLFSVPLSETLARAALTSWLAQANEERDRAAEAARLATGCICG